MAVSAIQPDHRRRLPGQLAATVASLAVALGALLVMPDVAHARLADEATSAAQAAAVPTVDPGRMNALVSTENEPAATNASHDTAVNVAPAAWTPHILGGKTSDIVQVGNTVVVGGVFSQVAPSSGAPVLNRANVFAFNAANGAINTGFAPSVGGEVRAVEAGPTADTVYIGGSFQGVNGLNRRVALLNVNTGQLVSSFEAPAMNGAVNDLVRIGDRLYVAGVFTHVGGREQLGLVGLNATTGAREDFLNIALTENHNYTGGQGQARAPVGGRSMAINPQGTDLAVIGNFRRADGLDRRQMVMIDLTGDSAQVRDDWRTRRYDPSCFSHAFDTYMRDVNVSPDGAYVVVATTGGPNPGTLCDTLTRWDFEESGQQVQPAWIDDTGGDTLLSAATSGAAVYTGGHQRWHNNHGGRDHPAPGAVGRAGMAAVDVDNGLPISWNPGRSPRGVGAEAMYITDAGLWVGSDTEQIGHWQYRRPRLAFFPVSGGEAQGPGDTGSLPANVYLTGGDGELTRVWYEGGSVVEEPAPAPQGDLDWDNISGAVVIDGELFYTTAAGTFARRAFNGESYGPPAQIDPYNDPHWSTINTGSGGYTYRGVRPNFYNQLASLTGMAYADGRLYYTRAGSDRLYSRAFLPQSGIITQAVTEVSDFAPEDLGGIFFDPDGQYLYYSDTSSGALSRIGWSDGAVQGSASVVSGPELDGMDWRGRAMFIAAGPAPAENQPPAAVIGAECFRFSCDFDASNSEDLDGEIVSYLWDFGDGVTSDEVEASHTYTEPGEYTVTLTVTDDRGAIGSETYQVEAFENRDPVAVLAEPVCVGLECSFDASESSDPDDGDSIVEFGWDFGDGSPEGSGESVSHTFPESGSYTVTLTVTDQEGATGTDTREVEIRELGLAPELVGHEAFSGHVLSPRVAVPEGVQAGDVLLLFVTAGSAAAMEGPAGVTGWEEVSQVTSGPLEVTVFAKVADGSEAGEDAVFTLPQLFKTDLVLAAYRGVNVEEPVELVDSATALNTTTHTTPTVQVPGQGRAVLSFWAERSSATSQWSAPDEVSVISSQTGVGGGRVGSLLAQDHPQGDSYGGLVAETDGTSARSVTLTILLRGVPE